MYVCIPGVSYFVYRASVQLCVAFGEELRLNIGIYLLNIPM